ncbi:hypothetical protein GE09DRAFT_1250142 [Coniochaeta sp. 2T2.1]|nr:hypothetical protein GE09DRAFT_1250142 [Coniochaeta sp. 2T2.1]
MVRENDDAASPASDRILDRKIESRALPASFSSNLGRKAPVAEKGGKVKSVRAIVDWLEKTGSPGPESPESKTQALPGKAEVADRMFLATKATTTTATTKLGIVQPSAPDPSTPISRAFPAKAPPTHPEEYSLTLLKYKSYFNNRPLVRCLDDEDEKVASPVAKPTPKAASAITRPDMSMTEKGPEPPIPSNVIAALMASLESAKDINNLRQNAQPGGKDPTATAQSPEPVTDQFGDLFSPPPSLQKINTHHSHHSSKHSAGHSHAFNGGRSHKASVASSGSTSRELMTTEERMSEADEFFAMDDDDDGGHVVGALAISASYGASERPLGSTLDDFRYLVEDPTKRMEVWK